MHIAALRLVPMLCSPLFFFALPLLLLLQAGAVAVSVWCLHLCRASTHARTQARQGKVVGSPCPCPCLARDARSVFDAEW